MFIAGTACIVTLSGSRNANVAAARADMVRECSSGRGPRCTGRQTSIDVYEATIRGHDARLADIGPALKPKTGYAYAGACSQPCPTSRPRRPTSPPASS